MSHLAAFLDPPLIKNSANKQPEALLKKKIIYLRFSKSFKELHEATEIYSQLSKIF